MTGRKKATSRSGRTCAFEQLESRHMLSAANLTEIFAQPGVAPAATGGAVPYTPAEIRHAYAFDQLGSFRNGAPANGSGQTIAIVDAYDQPNIVSDLHNFDLQYGLPDPPSFRKVNQTGGSTLPSPDVPGGWGLEISLDVEWAHAIAPGANILLVEAASSNLNDLLTAVNYAAAQPGVSVVSMSWGISEFPQETSLDSYFTTPAGHSGVSFVAATGDNSAPAIWPAASPNVVSVGGTSLRTVGAADSYWMENGWIFGGGGYSLYESRPSYQSAVDRTRFRATPDVAYEADPRTGYWVYDSYDASAVGNGSAWMDIGGTSAGTPQWAAILAIANQGRAAEGQQPLLAAPADIYQLPGTDFHDIATGYNGFPALPGYDLVTGRGTPYANRIITDLLGAKVTATEKAARLASAHGQSLPSLKAFASRKAVRADSDSMASDAVSNPTDNSPAIGIAIVATSNESAETYTDPGTSPCLVESPDQAEDATASVVLPPDTAASLTTLEPPLGDDSFGQQGVDLQSSADVG